MKEKKNYKWAAVVPLIGGMSLGNYMATGNKPEFMLSYQAFMNNDSHIRNHWPDVPYSLIDDETNQLMEDERQEENDCYKCHKENLSEKFKGIDFVSSVPPCAGLSLLNASTRKDSAAARGSDAVQNDWMYKSSEFVLENIQPKVLFGENAPGLFTKMGEGVVEKLKEIAEKYDYSFSMYKTNTIYHGVPQKRERTFYFFWKDEYAPVFKHYRRERKDIEEYLQEVPKDAELTDMYVGFGTRFADTPWYKYLVHKEGENWRDAVKDYKTGIQYLDKSGNLDDSLQWLEESYHPEDEEQEKWKHQFKKVVERFIYKKSIGKGIWDSSPHFFTGHINAVISKNIPVTVHPTELRSLNVRELIHLMGMPHDFQVSGKNILSHITQNVPSCTARDMTLEIMDYIDGKTEISREKFYKQNNAKKSVEIEAPVKVKELF